MLIETLLVGLLVLAGMYDLVSFRIPNLLVMGVAALFIANVLWLGFPWKEAGLHILIGVAVFAVGAVLFRFHLVGGGDVKLFAATAMWSGPPLIVSHLFLTSLAALGLVMIMLAGRQLYAAATLGIPALRRFSVPRVLQPGVGVPYGVAIAASAVILTFIQPMGRQIG
jgi:prepilin peptidase CpaA